MDKPLHILLLEDNAADVELLVRQLNKADMSFELHLADSKQEFIAELNKQIPDIVLSDHSLPSFNSLEAMRIVKEKGLDIPFILVTGSVSEEFAVQCMREGSDDYILKNSLVRLPSAIESSISKRQVKREKQAMESLHAELKQAYVEIEQMHKDITDSINYAKQIQEAMLPETGLLEKYIPKSFIIYKPKDIISGDFYWFNEVAGKIVVVVADCTGHGVPGALMSMVGNNLLNDIVSAKKITRPGKILSELDAGVRKLLKQDVRGNKTQDGMDITVCSIDKKTKTLEFAGAKHHLFYFRERKLELIKGDRMSVGGFQTEAKRTYTNHKIHYTAGDTLYMFSDGYADQFGGRKDKRMQTKNLVKLIQSTLALGLQEQEDLLLEWFSKWKGSQKQTDDILLIGMQL